MTDKNIQKSYMTVRQFTNKYKFKTYQALRYQVYNNSEFAEKCVRRFGKTLLIDEQNTLDYIEGNSVQSK